MQVTRMKTPGSEAAQNTRTAADQAIGQALQTWATRQQPPDRWDQIRARSAAEAPAQVGQQFERGYLRRHLMSHKFIGLGDFLAGQEHYKDLLREAEQSRLVASLPHRPISRRALAWLGRELVALGSRISERYEDASREWAAGSDWPTQQDWAGDCQPAMSVQARK